MKNANNSGLNKVSDILKSKVAQISGALAIIAALNVAAPKSAEAQTLVNKKDYALILQNARNSQETIGEDMAKFVFGGGVERRLQLEIEKQNSKHGEKYEDEDFSLFKNESVKNADEKGKILSKEAMEKKLLRIVDSITTNDVATFYLAFQGYEESGVNLVGNKKGKGELPAGWDLAGFPVDENVNYLIKNATLPYTKDEQAKLKSEFEAIYESELSKRKAEALDSRKSKDKTTYESANLLALEKARENIVKRLYEKYIQPIIEKTFKQFYSTKEDKKGK